MGKQIHFGTYYDAWVFLENDFIQLEALGLHHVFEAHTEVLYDHVASHDPIPFTRDKDDLVKEFTLLMMTSYAESIKEFQDGDTFGNDFGAYHKAQSLKKFLHALLRDEEDADQIFDQVMVAIKAIGDLAAYAHTRINAKKAQ